MNGAFDAFSMHSCCSCICLWALRDVAVYFWGVFWSELGKQGAVVTFFV